MRTSKIILAASAGLAAALTIAPASAQNLSFSQVERGRYLATVGNCAGCHTDEVNDGERYAGGREMETPFGSIYTPNITFDNETGLGLWTRDDFYRAMNEGIARDGSHLYPAFPYPYFTLMPRQEIDAIYDYLSSIEPVYSETPEPQFPFPLNIRQAVMGWNLLYFEPQEFVPDPEQSDEWNRGRYLVDGPAHCGACHTDKNFAGADIEDEYLRGGVLEDWLAPNIRGGENGGIAHWSEDDIVAFLEGGRNDHTGVMPRMGEVVVLSTQYMETADLEAIAIYLKTLDDEARDPVEQPSEAIMTAGGGIYFDNCAACHASDGTGVPEIFAPLAGSNKVNAEDPITMLRVILEGTLAVPTNDNPGPIGMPAFDWKLTDQQIADLATFLRASWGNSAPAVSEGEVADLRERLDE